MSPKKAGRTPAAKKKAEPTAASTRAPRIGKRKNVVEEPETPVAPTPSAKRAKPDFVEDEYAQDPKAAPKSAKKKTAATKKRARSESAEDEDVEGPEVAPKPAEAKTPAKQRKASGAANAHKPRTDQTTTQKTAVGVRKQSQAAYQPVEEEDDDDTALQAELVPEEKKTSSSKRKRSTAAYKPDAEDEVGDNDLETTLRKSPKKSPGSKGKAKQAEVIEVQHDDDVEDGTAVTKAMLDAEAEERRLTKLEAQIEATKSPSPKFLRNGSMAIGTSRPSPADGYSRNYSNATVQTTEEISVDGDLDTVGDISGAETLGTRETEELLRHELNPEPDETGSEESYFDPGDAPPDSFGSEEWQKDPANEEVLLQLPPWLLEDIRPRSSWRIFKGITEEVLPRLARLTQQSILNHTLIWMDFFNQPGEYEASRLYQQGDTLVETTPLAWIRDFIVFARGHFNICDSNLAAGDPLQKHPELPRWEAKRVARARLAEYDEAIRGNVLAAAFSRLETLLVPHTREESPRKCKRIQGLSAGLPYQALNGHYGGYRIVERFMIPVICTEIMRRSSAWFGVGPQYDPKTEHRRSLFRALALGYYRGLQNQHVPSNWRRGNICALPVEYGAAAILRAWEDTLALTADPFVHWSDDRSIRWGEIFLLCTGSLPPFLDDEGRLYTGIFERPEFEGPVATCEPHEQQLQWLWDRPEMIEKLCLEEQSVWLPRFASPLRELLPTEAAELRRAHDERLRRNQREEQYVPGRRNARREPGTSFREDGFYPIRELGDPI